MAAAYAPDLAESLLGFCQWLSKTWPGFQSAQVTPFFHQHMPCFSQNIICTKMIESVVLSLSIGIHPKFAF
jgi:hypothetical protein